MSTSPSQATPCLDVLPSHSDSTSTNNIASPSASNELQNGSQQPRIPMPPPLAPGMPMPIPMGAPLPPGMPSGPPQLTQPEQPPLKPNRTLYINNLDSKIKTDRLKRELRAIFENFGEVRDIIAMKSFWRRGQAWVIFANQESADKALTQLQGFPYNNKEMRIQYARETSDLFAKEEGTFIERPPGPKKPRAIIEREQRLQVQLQQFQQMMQQHMLQLQQQGQLMPGQLPGQPPQLGGPLGHQGSLMGQQLGAPGMGLPGIPQPPPPGQMTSRAAPTPQPTSKEEIVAAVAAAAQAAAKKRAAEAASHINKMPRTGDVSAAPPPRGFSSGPPPPVGAPPIGIPSTGFFGGPPSMPPSGSNVGASALPNTTLFIENLPDDCETRQLEAVFQQYPGCKDIRLIASKRVAFVDYETIPQASVALRCLNNFSIKEGQTIRVSYAK